MVSVEGLRSTYEYAWWQAGLETSDFPYEMAHAADWRDSDSGRVLFVGAVVEDDVVCHLHNA